MQDYQLDFIQFALQRQVLRFGEFTLKSGRISPYFFNAGLFNDGLALAKLGGFYAAAVQTSGARFDTLFGPAYKGIPLVAATAIALAEQYQINKPYCFNRKEPKGHGEGGQLVGAALHGRVLIIDDVITAGTAIRESIALITQCGAQPAGIIVALDRQEKGPQGCSAIEEIEQSHAIPVYSIIHFADIVSFIAKQEENHVYYQALLEYRQKYGV